jgi:hypothetical protein
MSTKEQGKKVMHFKAPPQVSYAKIPASFVAIIIATVFIYFFLKILRDVDIYDKLENDFGGTVLVFFTFIMVSLGLYSFISQIIGLWIESFFIELYEDKIVGYNIWKKEKSLAYAEIVAIKKYKGPAYCFRLYPEDSTKASILLSAGIKDLKGLVKELIARCPNLKEIDHKHIDKLR